MFTPRSVENPSLENDLLEIPLAPAAFFKNGWSIFGHFLTIFSLYATFEYP
jgi:hypothetical protein